MNKLITISIICCFTVCSKPQKVTKTSDLLLGISKAVSINSITQFYSKKSNTIINKIRYEKIIPDASLLALLQLTKNKSKWTHNLKIASDNQTAKLQFIFTKHPVQNMLGYTYHLNCIYENNSWKIDYSKELNNLLKNRGERRGIKQYINSLK